MKTSTLAASVAAEMPLKSVVPELNWIPAIVPFAASGSRLLSEARILAAVSTTVRLANPLLEIEAVAASAALTCSESE